MKIQIEKLGRVNQASIDLDKKFIILTGQNNSGKTWVSYLVYGIFSLIENVRFVKIDGDLSKLKEEKQISINFESYILENILKINEALSKLLLENLSSIFKAEKTLFRSTTIDIAIEDIKLIKKIKNVDDIHKEISLGKDVSLIFEKEKNEVTGNIFLIDTGEKYLNRNFDVFFRVLASKIFGRELIRKCYGNVYLMPAERIAINIFSKEMSLKTNKMIDDIKDYLLNNKGEQEVKEFINSESSRYPLPISNALQIAEDLSNLSRANSRFDWLAKEIEQEILQGKVSVNEYGDFEFTPHDSENEKLAIHLTGSIVKSFASIVFYFRHLAEPGDFIIIDEPEINLHPDNQVILARILAKIVNSGFKLMISTHSEYILKEINYFVNMQNKPEIFTAMSEKYGYTQDILLNPDDLSVYLFRDDGSCQEIAVKQDGFDIETIDQVINEQSQKSLSVAGWNN